jgi:hypothetical protein
MSCEQLSALLFDNTDKIPEGLYLQLMNMTRDIHLKQTQPPQPNILPELWVRFNDFHLWYDDHLSEDLEEGDIIQFMSDSKDVKRFYKMVKVNKKSFVADIISFYFDRYNPIPNAPRREWILRRFELKDQKISTAEMKKLIVNDNTSRFTLFNKLSQLVDNQTPIHKEEVKELLFDVEYLHIYD